MFSECTTNYLFPILFISYFRGKPGCYVVKTALIYYIVFQEISYIAFIQLAVIYNTKIKLKRDKTAGKSRKLVNSANLERGIRQKKNLQRKGLSL